MLNLARAASRAIGGTLAIAIVSLLTAYATPLVDLPRPSRAIDHPEETFLGRTFATQLSATPGQSGFRLLVSVRRHSSPGPPRRSRRNVRSIFNTNGVADDATATLLLYQALRAAEHASPACVGSTGTPAVRLWSDHAT